VDWLPDVAERWSDWNEDVQADFTLEWMALMTNLTYVLDQVVSGRASPEETVAYEKLQADLRAAAPIPRKAGAACAVLSCSGIWAPPAGRRASA